MGRNCILAVAAAAAAVINMASAQAGPNTLAQYNPMNRTQSSNSTLCILPITKQAAQAVTGFAPLDVPVDVLPSFPAGMHPLLVEVGYSNDIRMTPLNLIPLQIPALMQASVLVPYTDVTQDGKTPISYPLNVYIGGTNGQDVQAIVPTLASGLSPFEGTTAFAARFAPDTSASQPLNNGLYSAQVKPYLLPNQVSGPGVYAEAFDVLYSITSQSPYTAHTFHTLVNLPHRLNNGRCQRNTNYYNETFAAPQMATGNVTLYHQILATPPADIEGQYTNVYCYQANAVQVASLGESCSDASANVDPAALQ
ncbi:hypothetical protein QQS21_012103 [Conoideocrella luteorostrata]|uniref:Uncharacterized protein n=1 Tax=Conoideocrella luteorostrata TaxID=1105319 RepID=A0AAJ0CC50_9HYPO|nr:hypothetical protein QQS21_012103 [Conoideocrella luteorostrata]